MKVLTLDRKAFGDRCRDLARCVETSGFSPAVLVGIRRGGEYVAVEMASVFPYARLDFIGLQRPSTASKGRFGRVLSAMFRLLPRRILDLLRITEAKLLSRRRHKAVAAPSLPPSLRGLGAVKVLLVDDAVDSGATMLAVAEALREANPEIDLRTAALTVTSLSPLVITDYSLFNNQTLIRFPWSMDAVK